jgi:hypothetical protein
MTAMGRDLPVADHCLWSPRTSREGGTLRSPFPIDTTTIGTGIPGPPSLHSSGKPALRRPSKSSIHRHCHARVDGTGAAEAAGRSRPALKVLYTSGYARNAIIHSGDLSWA